MYSKFTFGPESYSESGPEVYILSIWKPTKTTIRRVIINYGERSSLSCSEIYKIVPNCSFGGFSNCSNVHLPRFEVKFWTKSAFAFYGGFPEMARKAIEGDLSHIRTYMWSWDGSKFDQLSFSWISARNIDRMPKSRVAHFFSSKILSWLKIRIIFASNSISLRADQYFEPKFRRNSIDRILSHLRITCMF